MVHHLREKWWWWWNVLAPWWSILIPGLGCAWLLQDGFFHVLLPSRWYLLLKVEGNMGGSDTTHLVVHHLLLHSHDDATTTTSGHGGRGATV